MLRHACHVVYAALPLGALAVALVHPDWQLMDFGVAAVGHVLLLVYAPLLAAIGAVTLLPVPVSPERLRRQTVAIAVVLFSTIAVSAAAYTAFLFLRFFAMVASPDQDPAGLLIMLAWITGIACFPWAHIAKIEINHEPRTVNVDLVFASLAIGCMPIIAVVICTQAPVSLEFIASTFAVTMSFGLVALVRRIASRMRSVNPGAA